MVLSCDLSANGRNGIVWMLVAGWLAGWWIQLAHRLHLGVRLVINCIYYDDQNTKNYISLHGITSMHTDMSQCTSITKSS